MAGVLEALKSRILAPAVGPWVIPSCPSPGLSRPTTELERLATKDTLSDLFELLDQWPPRKARRHPDFLPVGREGPSQKPPTLTCGREKVLSRHERSRKPGTPRKEGS